MNTQNKAQQNVVTGDAFDPAVKAHIDDDNIFIGDPSELDFIDDEMGDADDDSDLHDIEDFGDIDYEEDEFGDIDDEEDEDLYGEIDTLPYGDALAVDIYMREVGAPFKFLKRLRSNIMKKRASSKSDRLGKVDARLRRKIDRATRKGKAGRVAHLTDRLNKKSTRLNRKIAALGLGATAAAAGLTAHQIRKAKRNRNMLPLPSSISLAAPVDFIQVRGAKLNSAPIVPSSVFPADMLKNMLDRQAMDTPFLQETVIGLPTLIPNQLVCTSAGVVDNRLFIPLILHIGSNALSGVPSTVVTITATIPTVSGVLTIQADPIQLTVEKGFDTRVMLFPWRLVANQPLPVLGNYSVGTNIVITLDGLDPATSKMTLIIPGSEHKAVKALRNALVSKA